MGRDPHRNILNFEVPSQFVLQLLMDILFFFAIIHWLPTRHLERIFNPVGLTHAPSIQGEQIKSREY